MRKTLSRFMANSLAVPTCVTIRDRANSLGPVTNDLNAYHESRKKEREHIIAALKADIRFEHFCSVGAGTAGEESLIDSRLTLIEPDPQCAEFLVTKHPRAAVIASPYERLTVSADLVYSASLGPWMNSDPTLGIDRDFLAFCERANAETVVALIYGGLHTAFVLDRRYYLERLIDSTNYTVALYGKYKASNALLVLTRHPRTLPNLSRILERPLIENGRIVCAGESKPLAAAMLSVAVHTLRNFGKILAEAKYLIGVNKRLLK